MSDIGFPVIKDNDQSVLLRHIKILLQSRHQLLRKLLDQFRVSMTLLQEEDTTSNLNSHISRFAYKGRLVIILARKREGKDVRLTARPALCGRVIFSNIYKKGIEASGV